MKPIVKREECIGCGRCAATCPEVFEMDEENLARAVCDFVPKDVEEFAQIAKENCPVAVIFLV